MYVEEESYSLVCLALVIIHTCLLQVVGAFTTMSDGEMVDLAERPLNAARTKHIHTYITIQGLDCRVSWRRVEWI